MTEQNNADNENLRPAATEKPAADELDAAGKSLSEALRISFIILKVIMIILVVAFLASGFETVDSDEQALVLRLGKIQGVGEKRLRGPGAHWIFPYPIDEIVKINVETQVNLTINSFWYFQTQEEMLSQQERRVRPDQPLNPLVDGYCISRSEKRGEAAAAGEMYDETILRGDVEISYQDGEVEVELKDFSVTSQRRTLTGPGGSDYNIVHTKWQLTYQIDDPERFFKNIHVEDVKTGDDYFDVITGSITPLLESLFEDTVVTEMVNYTIDEAISSEKDRIQERMRTLLQKKLDKIESGIKVVSVQLTQSVSPRQVKDAFQASMDASQTSQTTITNARAYAEDTLNKAGGAAQEEIAEARFYRTKVVETAKANADYLQRLLPEYRQRPKLVIQQIYLDAIEQIFDNADEKFVVQTAEGAKGTELRVLLNRDPSLKPKTKEEQTTQEEQ
ncbi:MAG: protease modulator HflK [Planctomycetota bacterium]|jgi:regulator of protease activity HflC (stomatin/prohibitin superfamily)